MSRHARFDLDRKIPRDMRGNFAMLFSVQKKKPSIQQPARIKPIFVGLFHGNTVPPKSSPRRSIAIRPRIERQPSHSMAFSPTRNGVRGLCTSRKRNSRMKVVPAIGRMIQKMKRQDRNCVKTPPKTGPMAPASAQMMDRSPR